MVVVIKTQNLLKNPCEVDLYQSLESVIHASQGKKSQCDGYEKIENENHSKADEELMLSCSVKIYLNENYDPNCITQIVTTSLKEIPVTSVDNIVVSVPNEIDSEECFSTKDFETFLQVWKQLENYQSNGITKRIGVSDFNQAQLKQLIDVAEVKPVINQVNVKDCCFIPKALASYAKENRVELLTHSDSTDLFQEQHLQSIFSKNGVEIKNPVKIVWISRYNCVEKSRGVAHDKRYLVALEN